MSKINIKRLYLALCNENSGIETFGTPEYVPGVQQFNAKHKINNASNYEEGVLVEQDNSLEQIEISFDIGHMDNIQIAKYLGHHVAATGGVYSLLDDVAPYVALLYEYEKGDHTLGYQVYYKGILQEPDDAVKQKEGKTDYQNHTVSSVFQPMKGHSRMYKYKIEQGDLNCPANISDLFFASVIIPSEDTEAPTVVSAPTDAATGVSTSADVVFTFNKAMDPNSIKKNNIFLMMADGSSITTTLSLDTTSKIATLHPSSALSAGAYIAVCTSNVKSISGVALAAPCIVNFTVQ